MMTERALVTGGTGFIGSHLVRALRAQGMEVRVLVRPSSARHTMARMLTGVGAELAPGDMLDLPSLRAALEGVTSVFHLAGRLLAPGVPSTAYARLHINGAFNLLTACSERNSLRTIVHCSTTGVLGPTGPTLAMEDMPMRPNTIYERTKAAGEQIVLSMAQRRDLPVVVARPALVYGPGDLHLLGWFRAIKGGYYRVVGPGDNLLHPIYIADLVDGLVRCAQTPSAIGRVYHLVGAQALPIRDLAIAISAALGRRLSRWHLPLPMALGIASALEALPGLPLERLPLTRSRITFMTQSRAYNGARAQQELGFVPHINLETGLQQTVAWYESEGLL